MMKSAPSMVVAGIANTCVRQISKQSPQDCCMSADDQEPAGGHTYEQQCFYACSGDIPAWSDIFESCSWPKQLWRRPVHRCHHRDSRGSYSCRGGRDPGGALLLLEAHAQAREHTQN